MQTAISTGKKLRPGGPMLQGKVPLQIPRWRLWGDVLREIHQRTSNRLSSWYSPMSAKQSSRNRVWLEGFVYRIHQTYWKPAWRLRLQRSQFPLSREKYLNLHPPGTQRDIPLLQVFQGRQVFLCCVPFWDQCWSFWLQVQGKAKCWEQDREAVTGELGAQHNGGFRSYFQRWTLCETGRRGGQALRGGRGTAASRGSELYESTGTGRTWKVQGQEWWAPSHVLCQ